MENREFLGKYYCCAIRFIGNVFWRAYDCNYACGFCVGTVGALDATSVRGDFDCGFLVFLEMFGLLRRSDKL